MRHRSVGRPPANVVALLVLSVITAACSMGDDTANGGLGNTSWTVVEIAGQPTAAGARPTMRFAPDGTISGSAGCNQYTGRFRTEGDKIAIGAVSSTLMGCEGELGQQEAAFLAGLEGASTWRQTETGQLEIGGTVEIVGAPLVAVPPAGEGETGADPSAAGTDALVGTNWTLLEMGGTADFARLRPSLHFGLDGMVSGFAGCNKFSGPVTLGATELRLGSLVTTKMACELPAGTVESMYLEGLAGATSWSIDATGQLVLGGAIPLTFGPG